MTIRDYGFSPMLDPESTARAESVVDVMEDWQLAELMALADWRKGYWNDLKTFAEAQAASILRELEDGTIDAGDAAKQLSGMAADLSHRMAVKFQLALVEIFTAGTLAGPAPAYETERILEP